jgi:hypothetical protein
VLNNVHNKYKNIQKIPLEKKAIHDHPGLMLSRKYRRRAIRQMLLCGQIA